MKIGIKYCGGCNPTYDRTDVVLRIKKYISQDDIFETIKQGVIYDIVLILCGCNSACASHINIEAKFEKIFITSGNDKKVFNIIEKINVLALGGVDHWKE